jgi:hypothetical protein
MIDGIFSLQINFYFFIINNVRGNWLMAFFPCKSILLFSRAITLCISDFSVVHWHHYAFILSSVNVSYTRSLTAFTCADIFIFVYWLWAIYPRIKSRLLHCLDYSALSTTSDTACIQLQQDDQHSNRLQ